MAHSASKSYENWSISLTWPINISFSIQSKKYIYNSVSFSKKKNISFSSVWPQDILMLVVRKESNLKLFQFRFSFKARCKCGWLIDWFFFFWRGLIDWLSYPYTVDKIINVVIPNIKYLSLLPKLLIIGPL